MIIIIQKVLFSELNTVEILPPKSTVPNGINMIRTIPAYNFKPLVRPIKLRNFSESIKRSNTAKLTLIAILIIWTAAKKDTFLTLSDLLWCRFIYLELPTAAKTPCTRFRWWQPVFSGEDYDQWAVDDIIILSEKQKHVIPVVNPTLPQVFFPCLNSKKSIIKVHEIKELSAWYLNMKWKFFVFALHSFYLYLIFVTSLCH